MTGQRADEAGAEAAAAQFGDDALADAVRKVGADCAFAEQGVAVPPQPAVRAMADAPGDRRTGRRLQRGLERVDPGHQPLHEAARRAAQQRPQEPGSRQRNLGHSTPVQTMNEWYRKKPELFKKRVYDHSSLDIPARISGHQALFADYPNQPLI
ncbi:MAG: hypothetical protein HZT40_14770 [Candidatus Thiothrix singaporensis]|uniref:Uncharacterized protein n=1 Tax=Candidatus Thiothrix singaporensis TaxID=2799669 RepID=A0A7L6AU72_9GAMM|nr:MAG: hypothetical protein HZT40_14770 [Candidatus Thiothrix singaporensis]